MQVSVWFTYLCYYISPGADNAARSVREAASDHNVPVGAVILGFDWDSDRNVVYEARIWLFQGKHKLIISWEIVIAEAFPVPGYA